MQLFTLERERRWRAGPAPAAPHAVADQAAQLEAALHLATAGFDASERDAIYRLARLAEPERPEIDAHLLRLAAYAHLVASNLGLPRQECELIRTASLLHDIGKLGLSKALPEHGADALRSHPRRGAELLAGSLSPLLCAGAVIALTHHEHYDGSGYPSGLAGPAIPLYGRIVAVADAYEALTARRLARPRATSAHARARMLAQCGSQFDPACVAALLRDSEALAAIDALFDNDTLFTLDHQAP